MSCSTVVLDAAQDAGDAEQQEADQEDPLAAVPISQPTAEHEEAGEDDVVGVHRPLKVVRRRVEGTPDEWQSHVGDRHVDAGDERAHAQHHERDRAAVPGHRRPGRGFVVMPMKPAVIVHGPPT